MEEKITKKTKTAKKPSAKKSSTKPKASKKAYEPRNVKIEGFNGLQLNTYVYENVKEPKAVVVVVHGMQEHCLRYDNFARFLNEQGYIVVTSDLRGHGKTAPSKDKLGFGEKDIFTETIKDQLIIIDSCYDAYKLPIYLFGHSYGSMLGQHLVQNSKLIEKAVLCGTTNGGSPLMKLGGIIAKLMSPFKNKNARGGLIEKMCIQSYGKKFENGNWLTRDDRVFEEYQKDEYCGGSFPFSFYKSMITNMNKANTGIPKIANKKIFLIAGDKDPVGENGRQVTKLYKLYLKNNINAKIKLYKDARHELLNEINKKEVYEDIVNFYNN